MTKKLLIIVCILTVVLGVLVITNKDKIFDSNKQVINNQNNTIVEDKNETNVTEPEKQVFNDKEDREEPGNRYGILFDGYTPFTNIDYNSKVNKQEDKVFILKEGVITYATTKKGKKYSIKVPNVVSARLSCSCGGCTNIYYLDSNKDLYDIKLGESGVYDKNVKAKKIRGDVKSLALDVDNLLFPTTCGEEYPIVKYINEKERLLEYKEDEDTGEGTYKDLSLDGLKRMWITSSWMNDWKKDADLYIAGEKATMDYFFKDENNNIIKAKAYYINTDVNESGDVQPLYVLGEDYYVYVFDNFIDNPIGKKHNESKVESFEVAEYDNKYLVKVKYISGKIEEFDKE